MIEPGILAMVLLVAVPAHMLVGALLTHSRIRSIRTMADEILSSPEATGDDRSAISEFAKEAGRRWPVWIVAATAPLWFIPLFAFSIYDAVRYRGFDEEEMLRQARESHKALEAKLRTDPAEHSSRFLELKDDLTNKAETASILGAPIATLWVILWMLPALAVYLLIGAAGVAMERLRLIIDETIGSIFHWGRA